MFRKTRRERIVVPQLGNEIAPVWSLTSYESDTAPVTRCELSGRIRHVYVHRIIRQLEQHDELWQVEPAVDLPDVSDITIENRTFFWSLALTPHAGYHESDLTLDRIVNHHAKSAGFSLEHLHDIVVARRQA